jgi:hypothetical protein
MVLLPLQLQSAAMQQLQYNFKKHFICADCLLRLSVHASCTWLFLCLPAAGIGYHALKYYIYIHIWFAVFEDGMERLWLVMGVL